MRLLFFLIGLHLACCNVLPEFTNDDFDVQIKQKKFMLIMFYAPWCGHCKRLKPAFLSVGQKLMSNENVGFALVDCTTQEALCSRFKVSGYPTLKFFKDGEYFLEYDGSRDENGLMKFALSRSQPPSRELHSKADLEELLASETASLNPVLVSFIAPGSDKFLELHNSVASGLMGDVVFANTFDANVLENPAKESFMRLYRPKLLVTKLTEPFLTYDGDHNEASIRSWILRNGHGLVGYRSESTSKLFPQDNILILYHNASIEKYQKGVNYYRNRLTKALKESGIDLSTITAAYCHSEDFYDEVSSLSSSGPPTLPVILLKHSGKKYKLDDYSQDNLLRFLKSFETGTLEPFIKSEPIPTQQSTAALQVVGHTFDEIVNDPNKDVFIMFHAPWCGHCKQLKPKYEKVAEKLKNEPGILMVTYDATANDVPHPYEVHGYPTLYFATKNLKHAPKRYEGGREEEDLLRFIAKESTAELQGYDRDGKEKKAEL